MKRTQKHGDFDDCETLNSLREHKLDPRGRQDSSYNPGSQGGRHHNDIETNGLLNHSGKDEYSVDSSVGHTISLTSDHTLLLPQYLKPISNSK